MRAFFFGEGGAGVVLSVVVGCNSFLPLAAVVLWCMRGLCSNNLQRCVFLLSFLLRGEFLSPCLWAFTFWEEASVLLTYVLQPTVILWC